MMKSFEAYLDLAAGATEASQILFRALDESLDESDAEGALKAAMMLATLQAMIMRAARQISRESGIDPREVITRLAAAALATFPEPEPPKVEDLPKRAVRPGPSPWGL